MTKFSLVFCKICCIFLKICYFKSNTKESSCLHWNMSPSLSSLIHTRHFGKKFNISATKWIFFGIVVDKTVMVSANR